MLSNFALSQILIGVAICSDIFSFQFKERKNIVTCLVVSAIFISAHFMLLGHWTAGFLGLLAVARFTSSIFTTSKRVMWFFLIVTFAISGFSFEGILSVLGGTATIFTTLAAFSKNDKLLRQLMLIGTMIWIIHNYLAGSPGAVLMEAIFIGSNLVGYFRYYIRPKKMTLHP
ncbi:MAG: YgjV family protein [Desulfotalea sp.]